VAEVVSAHGLVPAAAGPLCDLVGLLSDPAAPTAVHDPARAADVHIADSLVALEVPEVRAAERIADLGAGAGVPGLVLAIALPASEVVLVESARRKCAFIERAIEALGLDNARVVCTRVEQWVEGAAACDAVCVRALGALPVLCEYAAPLLREGGTLVAWKGLVEAKEAADGRAAAAILGLEPAGVLPVRPYAGSERRTLHLFRKVAPTPADYPRRPGIATKRPLSADIRRPRR
jgi:16S rRNA (guanine527-N7)-methyltransferase